MRLEGEGGAKNFAARWHIANKMGIKQRRYEMLIATAQRYRFISVIRQWIILGKAKELGNLKKNLPGLPIFKRGNNTVTPDISKIKFLI